MYRTQRLNKSKNKGCVQPYQTAAYFLCGGVGSWLAAVLPAQNSAGTSLAAMVMIVVMLPCFLFAMYEKHGQPLEVVIRNIINTKFTRPKERPYQTQNFYAVLERQAKLEKEVSAIAKGNFKKATAKKPRSRG